jgi:hypothetical protein
VSLNIDINTARYGNYYEAARAVAYIVFFGLIYGSMSLSTNLDLPKIGFILLTSLQLARTIFRYKRFSSLGLVLEFGFLAVLLFGIVESCGWNLRAHPIYSSLLVLVLVCSSMKGVLFGIDS